MMEISEIEILTDNLAETEAFYSETLGLSVIHKNEKSISFRAGQSILTFLKSNALTPKYHFAFNIPNNKLEESITWAKSKLNLLEDGNKEIVANFESWNAKAIYFFDNNKNILEFIARFDLQNCTDEPFGVSSIESISEIGIVADQPMELAEKLLRTNNLSFFEKGVKSEKFAVLGDDHGLLIIVETARKWYPTDQEAEKHYARIVLSIDGLKSEIIVNE